jgi:hypothetical protein
VAFQQNPDGFPPDTGHQFSLHRLLRHPTDAPAGAAFRRIAANHRNHSLLLPVIQQFGCSGPLLFLERTGQTLLPIAMADLPNGLYCQRDNPGNMWRTDPLGELQKSHRPHDNSYRLHTTAQQPA